MNFEEIKNKLEELLESRELKGYREKEYVWEFKKKGLNGKLCEQTIFEPISEEPESDMTVILYKDGSWSCSSFIDNEVFKDDREPHKEISSQILNKMIEDIRSFLPDCSRLYKTKLKVKHIKNPSFLMTIYNFNHPETKELFLKKLREKESKSFQFVKEVNEQNKIQIPGTIN